MRTDPQPSRRQKRGPEQVAVAAAAPGERVQKVLAGAGLGSRRELEAMILEGRIKVNGDKAVLGQRVSDLDRIQIDGKVVPMSRGVRGGPQDIRLLLYNKPIGEICTRRDPDGRATAFDRLPRLKGRRWVAIGRLDLNTSGLLLFSDDGELANRLMHPSFGFEREYEVRVRGPVSDDVIAKFMTGCVLEDGPARFKRLERMGGEGANRWYRVVVTEGRNRLVRRLWESEGFAVSRLIRTRVGPFTLPVSLRPGTWSYAAPHELARLLKRLGKTPAGLR